MFDDRMLNPDTGIGLDAWQDIDRDLAEQCLLYVGRLEIRVRIEHLSVDDEVGIAEIL